MSVTIQNYDCILRLWWKQTHCKQNNATIIVIYIWESVTFTIITSETELMDKMYNVIPICIGAPEKTKPKKLVIR